MYACFGGLEHQHTEFLLVKHCLRALFSSTSWRLEQQHQISVYEHLHVVITSQEIGGLVQYTTAAQLTAFLYLN